MGNLGGESREQNRKDKVTKFRSETYARQLGVTTDRRQFILFYLFYFSIEDETTTKNGAQLYHVLSCHMTIV